MRNLMTLVAVLLMGQAVGWAVDRADLERRLERQISKFEAMQRKNPIPAETLKKARGIVLLDRTKAGFIFAFQGGTGVAMVRDKQNQWGPVAFLKANEASLGFQIGGQQSFLVMLFMNDDATRMLIDPTFEFGGEARGTAGDATAGAEGTVKTTEQPVLVYDQREGLFGGAAIKGGALSPDTEGNQAYYGELVTVKEILFDGKVKPTKGGEKLAKLLEDFSAAKPRE